MNRRKVLTALIVGLTVTLVKSENPGLGRQRRQFDAAENEIQGSAIDFSQAVFDDDTGLMCVFKESEVESIEKEPILECNHKEVEKCHYTYVTQFNPAQEEVCEESFEKTCQITFKQEALKEKIKKCYRPLIKVCNGQGKEVCETMYESACTTRYIEKRPGKFVGDTRCDKVPIEVCGAGCVTEEGPEECHDKEVTNLVDVPEEICDLNPQKNCRLQTKLVPSLMPKHECTIVPQEICNLKFTAPRLIKKPLMSKWCLDDSPSPPGESYNEGLSRGSPISAQATNTRGNLLPRPNDRFNGRSNNNNLGGSSSSNFFDNPSNSFQFNGNGRSSFTSGNNILDDFSYDDTFGVDFGSNFNNNRASRARAARKADRFQAAASETKAVKARAPPKFLVAPTA